MQLLKDLIFCHMFLLVKTRRFYSNLISTSFELISYLSLNCMKIECSISISTGKTKKLNKTINC